MPEIEDTSVCSRLKEERSRLGVGQDVAANACGVTRKTIGRWESNIPIPADKLSPLSSLGYDVCYVITGVKSPNVRTFERSTKTLELVEECAAALRIIERKLNLSLNDDKFGLIVRMLFEEYYDEFVGSDDDDAPAEGGGIDTAKVVQLVKLAS